MEPLDIFSVRDLRTRSGDLLRDAELGQLSLITKHGRPAILAVPFDRRLLDQGVHRALALSLYEGQHLTLAQAAKVAGLSLDGFIDLLGALGVAAVDYPPRGARGGAGHRAVTAVVVADAGPLIGLARIDRLSVLASISEAPRRIAWLVDSSSASLPASRQCRQRQLPQLRLRL